MTTTISPGDGDPVGGTGSPGGGSSGGTGATGTGTAIFDVTISKDRADSDLRVLAYAALVSGDDLQFQSFLTVDGVIQQFGPVNQIYDTTNSKAAGIVTLPAYLTGLAAGPHRIIFSIRNLSVSNSSKQLTAQTGSYLEITELKNAAKG